MSIQLPSSEVLQAAIDKAAECDCLELSDIDTFHEKVIGLAGKKFDDAFALGEALVALLDSVIQRKGEEWCKGYVALVTIIREVFHDSAAAVAESIVDAMDVNAFA